LHLNEKKLFLVSNFTDSFYHDVSLVNHWDIINILSQIRLLKERDIKVKDYFF
jgi:hypothetical protein